MPTPNLSASQLAWVCQEVADYIDDQRSMYADGATPLTVAQKSPLQRFFSDEVVKSARLLILGPAQQDAAIQNPPFYAQLKSMGFDKNLLPNFADMAAITFVDLIVSNGPISAVTLFHELVHVVQYGKLGLSGFAAKYVSGFLRGGSYEKIPLEINAYQLDAEYSRNPNRRFAVEERVQVWMDEDRF